MPTIRDQAVCLRRWEFSETSQTVCLLTCQNGIINGLAKGARRERGSFSGGFEPLTVGQIVAVVKPQRELATLTAWHLESVCWAARQNLTANRAGLYMADLVHRMLKDHDPHEKVFQALLMSMDQLDQPQRISEALLKFQWILLVECGYQPELNQHVETGHALPENAPTLAFDPQKGGLVEDIGDAEQWRVRQETVQVLRRIATDNPDQLKNPEILQRANRLLAAYIREILGTEPATLRWAFPDLASTTASH